MGRDRYGTAQVVHYDAAGRLRRSRRGAEAGRKRGEGEGGEKAHDRYMGGYYRGIPGLWRDKSAAARPDMISSGRCLLKPSSSWARPGRGRPPWASCGSFAAWPAGAAIISISENGCAGRPKARAASNRPKAETVRRVLLTGALLEDAEFPIALKILSYFLAERAAGGRGHPDSQRPAEARRSSRGHGRVGGYPCRGPPDGRSGRHSSPHRLRCGEGQDGPQGR